MFSSRLSISLVLGASLLATSACKRGTSLAKEDLALVPQDTSIVVGINVARMRGTAMWKRFMDLAVSQDKAKKDYEDFSKACVDVNSADGPEQLFVALPQPTAASKDGAILIRLKTPMDDARLKQCADFMALKSGESVNTTEYAGKKVYGSGAAAEADKGGAALVDSKTIVIGSGAWLKKVIDLSSGKEQASAKNNAELVALVKRAKTSDAIWGAGIVPQSARDALKSNPQLAPLSSLKAAFGSMDFAQGLSLDVNMDTGSETDAKAITEQVTTQLAEVKKSPQVMMLGFGPMLDPIKVDAKGPTFHLAVSYDQKQVDDLVSRLQGLMKGLGGGMMMK